MRECYAIAASPQLYEGSDPNGIRTRVTAVKGRCPGPLDDRVTKARAISNSYSYTQGKLPARSFLLLLFLLLACGANLLAKTFEVYLRKLLLRRTKFVNQRGCARGCAMMLAQYFACVLADLLAALAIVL